jgi:hypothetical protein
MRLDFLMLADGANVAEGKIYVHGGGLTRATFPEFPSNPMFLTAVARFLMDADELGALQEREVAFEMLHDDGTRVELGGGQLRWDPGEQVREDEEQAVVLVAPMLIAFQAPGSYELRLLLDGEPVGTRRLLAMQSEQRPS